MTPYGWTKELRGNYQQLYEIGQKGVAALTAKFGTRYKLGSIANVICKIGTDLFYLNNYNCFF